MQGVQLEQSWGWVWVWKQMSRRSVFCWGENADWQEAIAYVSLTRLFMRLLIVNLVKTPDEHELDTFSSISIKLRSRYSQNEDDAITIIITHTLA